MTKAGNPGGFDWDQMEKFIGEQVPFLPKGFLKNRMNGNGAWIGDYVQDIMKKSFAQTGAVGEEFEARVSSGSEEAEHGHEGLSYKHKVFQTHNHVIVRVHIPQEVHYKNVKAYASGHMLKIEQDPSRKKMYIKLPAAVDSGRARAIYKERVLEIRIPKLDEAEMYQEIPVRYRG